MSRRKGRGKPRTLPKVPAAPTRVKVTPEEAAPEEAAPKPVDPEVVEPEVVEPEVVEPEQPDPPVEVETPEQKASRGPVGRAVLPAGSTAVAATRPDVAELPPQPEPESVPEPEPEPESLPTPPDATSAPVNPRLARLAWARVRRAAHPRMNRSQVLSGALVAALGFALVAQIVQHGDQRLTGLRTNELVQILDNLNDRRDRLNAEKADLEAERRQLASGTSNSQAAIAAAQSRLDALGILAGTVPAEGPGIQLTIRDPSGAVLPPRLLDLVQELRDAGAEAIQIGTARVVASTAFTDVAGGGVAVNGVRQRSPYVVLAIGDSQTMSTAMQIPGGAIASLPPGVTGSVVERDVVRITALRPVPRPRYAQPATTATPTR